jgi:hypothetical protein
MFFGIIMLLGVLRPVEPQNEMEWFQFKTHHPFILFQYYTGPVVLLVCGLLMLIGVNWSRWLYHAWFGENIIGNVVHSPAKMWPALIFYVVLVFCLYRPRARAFFRGQNIAPVKTEEVPPT